MIVVDTNILAYLYLPTVNTAQAESLLQNDPEWLAPLLWRSEFRNLLALYLRNKDMDFAQACEIQAEAETLLAGNEYAVDSYSVLQLTLESRCSAYDCEYVGLAKKLGIPLVTNDRKVLKAFPDIAVSLKTVTCRDHH
ncbi:MAG: type II toxin-antitoxin system VapC family toxin [Gammaproteobacteria bacterium]